MSTNLIVASIRVHFRGWDYNFIFAAGERGVQNEKSVGKKNRRITNKILTLSYKFSGHNHPTLVSGALRKHSASRRGVCTVGDFV